MDSGGLTGQNAERGLQSGSIRCVQSQYERLGDDLLSMKCATGQPTQRVMLGASAACWSVVLRG